MPLWSVFLDVALQIVLKVATSNKSILPFAVHRLGIDVVALLGLLHKPTSLLPLLVVLHSLLIHGLVVFVNHWLEVNLGLDDVQ